MLVLGTVKNTCDNGIRYLQKRLQKPVITVSLPAMTVRFTRCNGTFLAFGEVALLRGARALIDPDQLTIDLIRKFLTVLGARCT